MRIVALLAAQMSEAYERVRRCCGGLSEDEFSWEPVAGCWRVFRAPSSPGGWAYDYELPEPDPAPFTTIGWRLNHVALCKVMYHEYAFGSGAITWETIRTPGTAVDTMRLLEEGQAMLVEDLGDLSDEDLEREVLTNWGERWPAWRIFHTMVDHDVHHGAEIALLRDLFRLSGPTTT
jgi:uncharacterized damage-inducible protein DinB